MTDKQALREEFQYMQNHYSDPADRERQVIYIAAEALLDELEAAEKLIAEQQRSLDHREFLLLSADQVQREYAEALGCAADNESILEAIDDMKKRIAELEARTVTLPEPFKLAKSSSGLTYYYADEVDAAIHAAGIGKGE
ncbi:ead/Ea22-like family protein [Citrobacter koseri]|uniref:ead/Ea22-like family protein n=1 Tax=Citrobacter koseri TaxID=545 RepID=UPI001DC0A730|nr:ead/Ea22-like family protein [Citrobacter koseri]CAG0243683.1 hypothetical protein AN2353V1_1724 [Citrobacter koseri]CAH6035456.1 hypothetical protein AN2353V1_1724 [Citrobacter koseri]